LVSGIESRRDKCGFDISGLFDLHERQSWKCTFDQE